MSASFPRGGAPLPEAQAPLSMIGSRAGSGGQSAFSDDQSGLSAYAAQLQRRGGSALEQPQQPRRSQLSDAASATTSTTSSSGASSMTMDRLVEERATRGVIRGFLLVLLLLAGFGALAALLHWLLWRREDATGSESCGCPATRALEGPGANAASDAASATITAVQQLQAAPGTDLQEQEELQEAQKPEMPVDEPEVPVAPQEKEEGDAVDAKVAEGVEAGVAPIVAAARRRAHALQLGPDGQPPAILHGRRLHRGLNRASTGERNPVRVDATHVKHVQQDAQVMRATTSSQPQGAGLARGPLAARVSAPAPGTVGDRPQLKRHTYEAYMKMQRAARGRHGGIAGKPVNTAAIEAAAEMMGTDPRGRAVRQQLVAPHAAIASGTSQAQQHLPGAQAAVASHAERLAAAARVASSAIGAVSGKQLASLRDRAAASISVQDAAAALATMNDILRLASKAKARGARPPAVSQEQEAALQHWMGVTQPAWSQQKAAARAIVRDVLGRL